MKTLLVTILCTAVVASSHAQDKNVATADYSVTADVQYCTGGGKPLLMDVFVPH